MGKAFSREMELKNNQWPLTLHLAALGLKLGCVMLDKQRTTPPFVVRAFYGPEGLYGCVWKAEELRDRSERQAQEGEMMQFFQVPLFPCSRCALQTLFSTFPIAVFSVINIFSAQRYVHASILGRLLALLKHWVLLCVWVVPFPFYFYAAGIWPWSIAKRPRSRYPLL